MQIARAGHAQFDVFNAAFIASARTDVPALIARVRELEAERDHERALLECAPWATYSEGETLLRAQAAEAQQLAKQMMDERDKAKSHMVCLEALLREKTEECDELDEERREAWQHVQNNMSHVLLKRAHGALADAGNVEVPPLSEPIDETIRAIVRERDELRAECAALRRELAALMDDH